MQVVIIKEDRSVMIDGVTLNFDFVLPTNVWAIQWDGLKGEVEFNDGSPNEVITDFTAYQSILVGYDDENKRVSDEFAKVNADAEAALTYRDRRKATYDNLNQFEMQFDDAINGTTTWVDAITAIKLKYPKL